MRPRRVSVESSFAFLTLPPFCVVQTVADASTSLARLTPHRPIKTTALGVSVTFALATFMWRSGESVGRLPGSVVVKRSTALAVISCSVVSANTFPMNHMVGPVSGGLVLRRRDTLLSVAIAEAASFHYQVIDGKVSRRRSFLR